MPHFLESLIPALIKPAMKQRGFLSPRILLEWEKIVGPSFAQQCYPDRILFPRGGHHQGTLYLIIDPCSAFRFEYIKDLILEKINTYFGYGAITQVKLFQKPFPLKKTQQPQATLPKDFNLVPLFPSTGHERLDKALQNYGATLMASSTSATSPSEERPKGVMPVINQ